MSSSAGTPGEYEVSVRVGMPTAELIRTLQRVPDEAEVAEHYGDVDLVIVLRTPGDRDGGTR
jgi:uncharacterized repeat protein (TIGR03917 family)